ncbi:retrovirus-related pol polyprotein from transposon TNT 1-94 [Tanacetum coccineum]
MCHIVGIEPQFENIIKNGPYIPMATGQRKPEVQWTTNERKAANLDKRLKSLIMSVLPDDQMNSVINCLTAKSTWDDLILYHEGPSDVKESRVMDLKLCYNTFKFKEGETLTQTFTRYKALMNELVNDGINLSKLEINTGFINGLPKKWLSFCQSLRNTNHVKDSELASLFGKLKYEENLIDSIYETQKEKSLVSATPLSTAFFSTSIVQDFQDSPDDEEDTRSSHEYLNDLEEEYQARALLAKSKRFFKKGVERPWLSEAKGFILPNLDTSRILPPESHTKTIEPPVTVTDSSATDYDSADESSVCSTPIPPLEKPGGAKPVSKPKAIKLILKSNSTFKMEALKNVSINEPSSAPAKINKKASASKINSAPTGKLKHVKTEDDFPLSICDIRTPIWYLDSGCSRQKDWLSKLPAINTYFTKVAFVNGLKYNLISISQLCDAKYIVQFDEKRGTIFNSNKEIVMINPRVRDVYVLDMTSSEPESCFFARATENLNWLWHKRLAHLNFKTIN